MRPSGQARRALSDRLASSWCWPPSFGPRSGGLIFLIADLLHPVNDLAVECFLNSNLSHGCGRRGAMPVFLAGRAADHIARPDHDRGFTPTLCDPHACSDDERLPEGMRVPGAPGAGFESDTSAADAGGCGGFEERINADRSREVLEVSPRRGLRAGAFDIHLC